MWTIYKNIAIYILTSYNLLLLYIIFYTDKILNNLKKMSTKHTLEQLVNLSKDVFKTCSINDALIELAGNRLGNLKCIHNMYEFNE